MGIQVDINSITGYSPYDVYICQTGGTDCYYMTRISSTPYSFEIPSPYDKSYSYMLKLVDSYGLIISGITNI